MAFDIDALTTAVSEGQPAGPDLSYDAARQDIESAFEKSVSDDTSGGVEVDWRQVIGKILMQAEQTRDIWLAVYLMRAGAKAGQLETVENGAALLAGLFEGQWETVHPQLDDYGFQGRNGPCESLTRIGEFLGPLRNVVMLEHQRLGKYSGADFERFRTNGDSEQGFGMFRALLEETSDDDLQALIDRFTGITDAIRRADSVLTANSGGDTGTNFQPTYDAIGQITRSIASFLRAPSESGSDILYEGGDATHESRGGENSSASFGGSVNSRQDVLRAIDSIADYYARKEPGSPVPFALRRARDWVSLDFLSVLEDIAPNSIEEARRVLVNGRNGDGYDSGSSASGDDGWSSGSES